MCAGAVVNARISSLIYGAADPKAGAVSSLMNLVQDERLNHRVEVTAGICQETCSQMLKDFFAELRNRKK
jgi:tRNA(adenine34) deaminase